jgi:predicted transcriptional regulator
MAEGYSVSTMNRNAAADARSLGVRLGRLCISSNVPVGKVATQLRVSRQTVYNWFFGLKTPHDERVPLVEAFMEEHTG